MTGLHVNTPHAGKTSTKNGKDNTTASWHDMLWVFHHGFDSQHDSACVASQSDIHKLPKSGKWQHSGRFDLSKTRRFPQEHGRITEYVLRMVGGNGEVREAGIGPLSSLPCNHLSGCWRGVYSEMINDQEEDLVALVVQIQI